MAYQINTDNGLKWRVGFRLVPEYCHLDDLVDEYRFTFGVSRDFPRREFLRRERDGYTLAIAEEFVHYLNWRDEQARARAGDYTLEMIRQRHDP